MALCHVTGTVYLPDGDIAARREVTFFKIPDTVTSDYLGAVVPEPVTVRTDDAGQVDVNLITGNYHGFVLERNRKNRYLFKAVVPEAATADFSDLITAADPVEPLPAWLQQALEARDEARDEADRAEAAADRAELHGRYQFVNSIDFLGYTFSADDVGKSCGALTNVAWELTEEGAGHYDHPNGSVGVKVIAVDGIFDFAAFGVEPLSDSTEGFIRAFSVSSARNYRLREGRYYSGNVPIPNRNIAIIGDNKRGTVVAAAEDIEDPDYMWASSTWLNNSTGGSAPVDIEGVAFDGEQRVKYPLLLRTYFSDIKACRFLNPALDGVALAFASRGRNGTTQVASTLVENKVRGCRLEGGTISSVAQKAFQVIDQDAKLTDMWFQDNEVIGPCVHNSMAGHIITGNHYYGASAAGVLLLRMSIGTVVDSNYFENVVEIDNNVSNTVYLNNNRHLGALVCKFGNAGKTIVIGNPAMQTSAATIRHEYFGTDKTVVVNGGGSLATTPVSWHNSGSTGRITLNGFLDFSTGNLLSGSRTGASGVFDVLVGQSSGDYQASSASGPNQNFTWVKRVGRWSRTGKRVTVDFYHEWESALLGTGDSVVAILPFPAAAMTDLVFSGVVSKISSTVAADQLTLILEAGSNQLKVSKRSSGGASGIMQKEDWTGTGNKFISGSITYEIA